jgi:uncharacterized membrane protein YjjP (DUF1212 family)
VAEQSNDRVIWGLAKTAVYSVLMLAAVIALFRYGVAGLWGSGSDLGLLAAVAVGCLGTLGLVKTGVFLAKDVVKTFASKEKKA